CGGLRGRLFHLRLARTPSVAGDRDRVGRRRRPVFPGRWTVGHVAGGVLYLLRGGLVDERRSALVRGRQRRRDRFGRGTVGISFAVPARIPIRRYPIRRYPIRRYPIRRYPVGVLAGTAGTTAS